MPKVDLAKRRRIMQRSRKLGHCICDPRRPCPCDVFTQQGICPCAGERPDPVDPSQVRLTELVHNAGCASKIAPGDLEAFLSRLPQVADPAVLSGMPAGDDAGVYRLTEGATLVQTVDVFTPCVDDPYAFGRICAANCLSDVYAMGGRPRTALSILGFPSERLDGQIIYQMLKGAMDVFAEAGVALIGGHSIKDEEIKLGFAITGTIEPDKVVELGRAQVGDELVLTKPLGVGVLNFARQIGRINSEALAEAERSMATLNKAAAEAMQQVGVSACTDVTGFGLFGHLIGMARHSGVTAQVYADALPALGGAVAALRDGVIPGAVERNREYVAEDIAVAEGVEEALVDLGFDAQTSGGLLIAVPQARHARLLEALSAGGVSAVTVGRIVAASSGKIVVTLSGRPASEARLQEIEDKLPHEVPAPAASQSQPCCAEVAPAAAAPAAGRSDTQPCCAEAASAAPAGTLSPAADTIEQSQKAFSGLIRATSAGGAIDARTKELIAYALVSLQRCGPCITIHRQKAHGMGITDQELAEAVWCATAIGGACVKVFHDDWLRTDKDAQSQSCCPK